MKVRKYGYIQCNDIVLKMTMDSFILLYNCSKLPERAEVLGRVPTEELLHHQHAERGSGDSGHYSVSRWNVYVTYKLTAKCFFLSFLKLQALSS